MPVTGPRAVRAAVHVHSAWSYDGSWGLDALVARFARRGYGAVLTAEHDRGFDDARWAEYVAACTRASTPDLLVVPGMEYADSDDVVHVPVWGAGAFLGAGRPTADLLADAAAAGGLAVFAHPARRGARQRFDPGWVPSLWGVEVWNRKYDGIAPSVDAARLAAGTGLVSVAALDFHSARQTFPLALRVTVDGPVTVPGVLAALAARRCRPEVLGTPALALTDGIPGAAARGLDRARRPAARAARRVAARH